MSDNEERDPVEVFTATLAAAGLRPALGYLNGRTRHRFTGVYRFDPPMLRSVCLFDRENPQLAVGDDTPMDETYCGIVGRGGVPFTTNDAGADPRLRAHRARAAVLAYCGVPLVTRGGRCIGSLCHFDVRPRLAPVTEIPLLARLAIVVAAAAGLDDGSITVSAAAPSERRDSPAR